MRALKPEYADHRVCAKCQAPAERIGRLIQFDDGGSSFRAQPIHHERGVFTHTCTRNSHETPDGKLSDDEAHRYACGALRDSDTRSIPAASMFGRCYLSDVPDEIPPHERQYDAAGDDV